MKKIIFIIFLLLLGVFLYQNRSQLLERATKTVLKLEQKDSLGESVNNEVTLPGTLKSLGGANSKTVLTSSGVITQTNTERIAAGLSRLTENAQLREAANQKLADMFDQQYFEHISPDGKGPSDLAKDVNYEYIIVGENLALGNFADDTALVTAWMNSPGHRANILNKKYSEIGVAVGQGLYEGKKTWLAVQEFGSPLSNCPAVDSELNRAISQNQKKIANLEQQLEAKRSELEKQRETDPEGYNREVKMYNTMVVEINTIIEQTKTMVKNYNAQINSFNACIKS